MKYFRFAAKGKSFELLNTPNSMVTPKEKHQMIEFLAKQLERSGQYKIHKHKNNLLVFSSDFAITMLCLTQDRSPNYAKEKIIEESKQQRKVGFLLYQESGANQTTNLSPLEQVIVNRLGAPKALAYYHPGLEQQPGTIRVFNVTQPSKAQYLKTPRSAIIAETGAILEIHNGYALLEPFRKQK